MEYEMVQEIQNSCPNNQMRDVFFEEVETHDPESYVRGLLKGRVEELTVQTKADGSVTIHCLSDGLRHKFLFTPI